MSLIKPEPSERKIHVLVQVSPLMEFWVDNFKLLVQARSGFADPGSFREFASRLEPYLCDFHHSLVEPPMKKRRIKDADFANYSQLDTALDMYDELRVGIDADLNMNNGYYADHRKCLR